MSEYKSALPEYPLTRDMWDILKEESRPIVIYGMGNGADSIIIVVDIVAVLIDVAVIVDIGGIILIITG